MRRSGGLRLSRSTTTARRQPGIVSPKAWPTPLHPPAGIISPEADITVGAPASGSPRSFRFPVSNSQAWAIFQRLPVPLQNRIKSVWRRLPGNRPRWGNLRRLQPFSAYYGFDRGTPVDRPYIDAWLTEHAHLIRGRTLEIRSAEYSMRYGSELESCDVMDIDPANPAATIVADANERGSLRPDYYDCIILTQTLQFLDPPRAIDNLYSALRPGGNLLISVPSASRVEPHCEHSDFYRWTPAGLRRLLQTLEGAHVAVQGRGNLLTVVAHLHGLVAEELREEELRFTDARYPLVAFATVQKPA